MKKLLNFRILLFLFFVVSMFSACNKTEKLSPEATNGSNARTEGTALGENTDEKLPKAKAVDGRLYFANTDEFVATIKSLQNRNESDYEQFEKNVGFSSLRTLNKKLTKDSSQVKFKDFNFPPHFTTLLNQDGEVQIGDTLMLYHGNTQYFILKNKESAINALRKGQLSDADLKNVVLLKREIKPFQFNTFPSPISGGRVEAYPLLIGQNVGFADTYYYNSGGVDFKIVFEIGHLYIPNYAVSYSEFYTRINIEYRQYSFWGSYYAPVGENTDRVINSVTTYGKSPAIGNNNFNKTLYNQASLNSTAGLYRTLASTNVYQPCANNNCQWTIDYFLGNYMGRHYNGSAAVIGYYYNPNLQF